MDPRVDADQGTSEWSGYAYNRDVQDRAWENGAIVAGNDPALWRKDEFGAWLYRLDYGNRRSSYGWEILDAPGQGASMVRPLHWQNYIDQVAAHTQSRMTASGLHNTRRLL